MQKKNLYTTTTTTTTTTLFLFLQFKSKNCHYCHFPLDIVLKKKIICTLFGILYR